MSLTCLTRRSWDFAMRNQSTMSRVEPMKSSNNCRPFTLHRFRRDNSTTSTGSSKSTGSSSSIGGGNAETIAHTSVDKRAAFMQDANAQMKAYHEARELMKRGKLPNINAHRGPKQNANAAQAAVVVVFVAAFFAMPFLGKTIATDDAFREKWVPSWYDFTVKKPENAWTRQELHEQMLAVQQNVRERAIAGDFTPDKLQAMQNAMQQQEQQQPHRLDVDRSKIPKEWDMIHPGMEAGEKLDESDD